MSNLVVITAILFLAGCTAGPELQKYSRIEIERPFTLPKGVAEWETVVPYFAERNDSQSQSLPPIVPIPLFWRMSLSDSLTLHWSPIPIALSWQSLYDDKNMLGVSAGLSGLGYATGRGLIFGPLVKFDYWHRLSRTVSLRSSLRGELTYYSESKNSDWRGEFSLGPLVQISDEFALQPSVGVEVRDGFRTVSNNVSPLGFSGGPVFYPVSLSAFLNLSRQWDMGATYKFLSLPAAHSYRLHTGFIFLTHSW